MTERQREDGEDDLRPHCRLLTRGPRPLQLGATQLEKEEEREGKVKGCGRVCVGGGASPASELKVPGAVLLSLAICFHLVNHVDTCGTICR